MDGTRHHDYLALEVGGEVDHIQAEGEVHRREAIFHMPDHEDLEDP